MKKAKQKDNLPVVTTQLVWLTNDIGGFITVYPDYLYIQFSHRARRKVYRIDGRKLYEKLTSGDTHEFEVEGFPDLTYITEKLPSGEIELTILAEKSKSDLDLAVVNRHELIEALYFWLF
ncbi:MAG TPA: hypothetical protein VF837_05370 [Patescibacteria group bacterium]